MNKNYFHEIVFSRLALGIFVIIMFGLVAFLKQPTVGLVGDYNENIPKLILPNGNVVIAEIADTFEERSKGLSGRDDLADNSAMVFMFKEENYHSFWMPDMNFPIDIVWLDSDYKVVDVARNVKPMPELEQKNLPKYINKKPAMYVLEFNAGFFELNNLALGQEIKLT